MWSAKYSVPSKTSQWPLAEAMRMCKLYVLFTRRRQAPLIPAAGGAAPALEGAKMAELHYMEMGWSGSGWMDPLPMDNTPAPTPSSTPASYDDMEDSTSRARGRSAPRRKSAKKSSRKSSRSSARKSSSRKRAKKTTKKSSKRSSRKSARKSAKKGGGGSARKSAKG